jgi:hypothetical protein
MNRGRNGETGGRNTDFPIERQIPSSPNVTHSESERNGTGRVRNRVKASHSPGGCTQRHRNIEVCEPHPPCSQLVQIGGGGTRVPIGTQVSIAEVISKDQNNVRWSGSGQA